MHAAVPLTVLYFPAAHPVHTIVTFETAVAPVKPALQLQFAIDGDPLFDSEFAGHTRHTLLVVAPVAAEYVFTPQFTQAALLVAFAAVENVPARQSMHPDPAVENLPAAHTPHAAALLTPATAPVPAEQLRHAMLLVAFVVGENVPARQSMHPEPAVEYLPAAHTPHAARLLAPAAAPVPAAQARHAPPLVAPVVGKNVPARQSRHPEPVVANFPAAQTPHAARLPAPVAAPVPAAQGRHAVLLVAPVALEYLPVSQFSQVLALAAEYLPALHGRQELAPVTSVPGQ
jgi:hypothetical protein